MGGMEGEENPGLGIQSTARIHPLEVRVSHRGRYGSLEGREEGKSGVKKGE